MKLFLIISAIIFQSCSTRTSNDESARLTKMWTESLNRTDIINIYGPEYNRVKGGIIYPRSKSTWPKYAFFFDDNNHLTNQFALLDRDELNLMKKDLNCSWVESNIQAISPHATQSIPIGECEKYSIKFEYKKDLGLYEVRRK